MRALAARHQVLAVEVTDPRELTLPAVGVLSLVDPETGALLEVDTGSAKLRERYARAAAERRAAVARGLRVGPGRSSDVADGPGLAARHRPARRERAAAARPGVMT